ncbi:hypothetical protein [Nonomuraea sp. CA-141351]|uniref:hypothetical protein n=1 Tax=Nonomuraea sp. CA-141351 TaxID=3239996 RepID=UPI003D8F3EBF
MGAESGYPRKPFDSMHLRTATVDDRFGMIWRDPDPTGNLADLAMHWHCPTLLTPGSFAYLSLHEVPHDDEAEERHWKFGVRGHGHDGGQLARQLHDPVQIWDRDWRNQPCPNFTLSPADAAVPAHAVGRIFPKHHTQLVMAWV